MRMRLAGLTFLVWLSGCGSSTVGTDAAAGSDLSGYPATCFDKTKDGDETDSDCGGSCPPCATGEGCRHGADCQDGVCDNAKCDPPSCSDMVKNGPETDVDCGGAKCPPCAVGQMCALGTDCISGSCINNLCRPLGDGGTPSPPTDPMAHPRTCRPYCGGPMNVPCHNGKQCVDLSMTVPKTIVGVCAG